jgi:hypothetical protein
MAAPIAHKIGVYSRPPAFAKLDKRTREAGFMAWVRHDLTEHIGGNPSVTQRMLIDRAAILSLRLAKLDQKIIADESFTLHDNNHAIAWSNALTRVLVALGVHGGRNAVDDIDHRLLSASFGREAGRCRMTESRVEEILNTLQSLVRFDPRTLFDSNNSAANSSLAPVITAFS